MLNEAKSITEILTIRGMAIALEAIASARGAEEIAALAIDIKLRAERKAGDFLETLPKHPGTRYGGDKVSLPRTLQEMGIAREESSRWQKMAAIPDKRFEELLANAQTRTQKAVLQATRDTEVDILRESARSLIPAEGKYATIVIDPPWPYGTHYDPENRRVGSPYPEMPLEEIQALVLPSADDCFLWLWTTNAFMKEAHYILSSWGFDEKTILTWAKQRIGVGYWLRGQTEHCLLGVKGEPSMRAHSYSTLLNAGNQGHSIKPEEFYKMIEQICPSPFLDYFARKERKGWKSFGTMEKAPLVVGETSR